MAADNFLGSEELSRRLYYGLSKKGTPPSTIKTHPYPEDNRRLQEVIDDDEYNTGLIGIQYEYVPYFFDFGKKAAKYGALAYGGFVRSVILTKNCGYKFSEEDYFAKDLDLWFKSEEKLRQFIGTLKEKVTIGDIAYTFYFGSLPKDMHDFETGKESYTDKSNPLNKDQAFYEMTSSYGFWKRKVDIIGYNNKTKRELGFVGSIDLVLSPDYMPVSDFVANTLTYNLLTDKYGSPNKKFSPEEIIKQICGRQLVYFEWGDTDIPKDYIWKNFSRGKLFIEKASRTNYLEMTKRYSEIVRFLEDEVVQELLNASEEDLFQIISENKIEEGGIKVFSAMARVERMKKNGWKILDRKDVKK